jgi:hypothetical protein
MEQPAMGHFMMAPAPWYSPISAQYTFVESTARPVGKYTPVAKVATVAPQFAIAHFMTLPVGPDTLVVESAQ